MTPLWLYLHFPDLYLHSLLIPDDQPVALLGARHQHVEQLNEPARKAGVTVDMSMATACSLCPGLICQPLDDIQQQQLLEQKALWAYRYSAQICLDPPQGLWLEIGSMLKLFGGLESLWQRLLREAPTQWPIQLGVAQAAQAARLLAINYIGLPNSDKHWIRQQLHGLTLAQLQLDESLQLKLQRVGAKTLGDLVRLPLADLAVRYGIELVDYLERIQGHKQQPMSWFEPPLRFRQDAFFIEEVEHQNGLLFPLRPLLAALSSFLQQRQLSTRTLILRLKHRHQPTTEWRLSFARAEHREQELLALVRYRFEHHTLPAPVTSLQLCVDHFEDMYPLRAKGKQGQNNHWDKLLGTAGTADTMDEASGVLDDSLLNRLQARLQHQQLFYLQANADPRPEIAGQLLDSHRHPQAAVIRKGLLRPIWLLDTPIPCPQPHEDTLILHRPERISSGWWDGVTVRRDYYLSLQSGQLLWIYRDASKGWFIQGLFG